MIGNHVCVHVGIFMYVEMLLPIAIFKHEEVNVVKKPVDLDMELTDYEMFVSTVFQGKDPCLELLGDCWDDAPWAEIYLL